MTAAGDSPSQMLLSVCWPRRGEFAASVVLAVGRVRDFKDPIDLVRLLSRPAPPATPGSGLR